jgi:hypothetical protein
MAADRTDFVLALTLGRVRHKQKDLAVYVWDSFKILAALSIHDEIYSCTVQIMNNAYG